MARIENNPTDKKVEPRKDKRRWWGRFFKNGIVPNNCLGRILLSLVIVICLLLSFVAYLGIVDIPVFSDLFFRPIQPIRIVEISPDKINTIGLDITQKMVMYAQRPDSELSIGEEELTALIRKALDSNPELSFRNVQAVVEHEGIELFGEVLLGDHPYHFTIIAMPFINQGDVDIEIKKANLEHLPISASLVDALLGQMLKKPLDNLNENMINYFNITQLKPQRKNVLLKGQVLNTQLPF
ncbi:hypothetical protein KKG41_04615 [Patescibacteria group bacterium]|nr:hypothetical protein [Patescibacteria group bacterium]MBU1890846.1 hypothetical protein [Patescibacteria group bacterium]